MLQMLPFLLTGKFNWDRRFYMPVGCFNG